MKTRKGFVSNSSSCSFIIGAGIIAPGKRAEIEKLITEKYGLKLSEFDFRSANEMEEVQKGRFFYETFNGVEIVLNNVKDDDVIVMMTDFEDVNEEEPEDSFYEEYHRPEMVKFADEFYNRELFSNGSSVNGGGYNG